VPQTPLLSPTPHTTFCNHRLRHLQVARFHGYFEDRKEIYLVLNYARLGNLYSYIQIVENGVIPLERARLYLRQVASALEYLKLANVCHRDLKQENVLLTSRDTLQICDFGWAIKCNDGEKRSTICGTPLYVPPEMLWGSLYSPSFVDAWSLGILAHELIFHQSPFDLEDKELERCSRGGSESHRKTIFKKIRNFTEWEAIAPAGGDSRAKSFITCLLQKDPTRRTHDALSHPFLLDQDILDENYKKRGTRKERLGPATLSKRRKLPDGLSFNSNETNNISQYDIGERRRR
jgi:serine/threonine protein kinase